MKKQFKNILKINFIIGKKQNLVMRKKKMSLNKKEWYRISKKIKLGKQKWNR